MIHLSHPEPSPLAAEIVASLAVDLRYADRFDLMMGIHPIEKRELTELEESAGNWISLLARDSKLDQMDEFSRALALWRDCWPDWIPSCEGRRSQDPNAEERWQYLLPHCTPIAAAYLFRPVGPRSPEVREAVERDYRGVFQDLERRARNSPLAKDHVTWTDTFFPSTALRQTFETLCGITDDVKSRLGLHDLDPGFLRRYVTANEGSIEELVKPNQFEYLVADMYRADGWTCHVTRYSKDGGVDIEATRPADDVPAAILIQVKRNRSKESQRGRARPVGLDDVKAFAATIRSEGKSAGVLVTSSHVTRDALIWAGTKGQRVANLTFVNGKQLRDRLHDISRRSQQGEVASYILGTQE